ncbi:serine hydroxymethyltransferase, partial [Candidatus Gribaldobacteria bacterium]|nr:serine hydroxymethyltransferase [Candidatus Gribaldobacteria bacterium]
MVLVYNKNTNKNMEAKHLKQTDQQIADLLFNEIKRQEETLMMIPSENHSSLAVKEVVGSVLQDKYCEGYPFKRYYQGQENFDQIESICQERVKKAFGVPYCNVQALSGAPANSAVYFALLNPGDKIMGLRLDQGGHISHGLKVNFSGKFFEPFFYQVNKDGLIDYDYLEEIALKEKPKMIIAGVTSFPLALDFERFGKIADKIDAWLLADVSHIAG